MIDTAPYRASFSIPNRLHVDELSFDGESVTIRASTDDLEARCPLCGRPSRRIHGCYTRTLADLPWCGTPVRLRVRVKKFFCDEPTCERRIFAERLENVAGVHARGTYRRREALEWIAFALGGEAGARLARELGLLVSPDTLLNRIREAFGSNAEGVRVVGVDDFGFRRGNAPGTILVDLERHRVVDLFEGHSVESIARGSGNTRASRWSPATARTSAGRASTRAPPTPSRSRTAGTFCTASRTHWSSSCCASGPYSGVPLHRERAERRGGSRAPSTTTFRRCPSAWGGRDPTPGIRSSYDESPEAHDGHKEDSLWERATHPNRSSASSEADGKLAGGAKVPQVARELGISEATFHRWRKQYGTMSPREAKCLKELEKENARLKKLVAEQALDIDMLKEVSRGNF